MSRSNYSDDLDTNVLNLWRGSVMRAIKGRRGQAFLKELLAALDALPEKVLISEALKDESGDVCAIGAVCVRRGLNVAAIDPEDPDSVANAMGIARALAQEIAYFNDERFDHCTPAQRFKYMREWVAARIEATA